MDATATAPTAPVAKKSTAPVVRTPWIVTAGAYCDCCGAAYGYGCC